jgi:hypothetical protein
MVDIAAEAHRMPLFRKAYSYDNIRTNGSADLYRDGS